MLAIHRLHKLNPLTLILFLTNNVILTCKLMYSGGEIPKATNRLRREKAKKGHKTGGLNARHV